MLLKPLSQTPAEIQKSFLKISKAFEIFILPRKNLSVKLGIFVMYISRFKSFDFVTWVWWNGSSINNVTIFKGSNIDKNLMIHGCKKEVTWGGSALCFWVVKKSVKTEHREEGVKKAAVKTRDVIYGRPQKRFSRQALTRSEIEKSF